MARDEHTITIPNDLAACQALLTQQAQTINAHTQTINAHACTIESHEQTIAELAQKNKAIEQEKAELALAFAELLQRAFRRRSERYLADPNQLQIDFGDSPEAADAADGLTQAIEEQAQTIPEHTRRPPKRKPRRDTLPEHLPRYEVEAETPDDMKHCPAHGARRIIGYDRVETLEFMRQLLRVRVTKYPKFACEGAPDCGIASAERPTALVEGNRYDTSRPPASMLAVPGPKWSPASTVIICPSIARRTTSPVAAGHRAARRC